MCPFWSHWDLGIMSFPQASRLPMLPAWVIRSTHHHSPLVLCTLNPGPTAEENGSWHPCVPRLSRLVHYALLFLRFIVEVCRGSMTQKGSSLVWDCELLQGTGSWPETMHVVMVRSALMSTSRTKADRQWTQTRTEVIHFAEISWLPVIWGLRFGMSVPFVSSATR